jgi:hypothetical protein
MKYFTIILSAIIVILLICFILCKKEVTKYETIIETPDSAFDDIISLDSLEILAIQASAKNKLRHQYDLKRIDSLNSVCADIRRTQQEHPPNDIYASEVATTTVRDTIIYIRKFRDTIIYKIDYEHIKDTIYKTIEIVDTIYKTFRKRRER